MIGFWVPILALLLAVPAHAVEPSPLRCESIVGPLTLSQLLEKYQRYQSDNGADTATIVSEFKGTEDELFKQAHDLLLKMNSPYVSHTQWIEFSLPKERILAVTEHANHNRTVRLVTTLIQEAEAGSYLSALLLQRNVQSLLYRHRATKEDLLNLATALDAAFEKLNIANDVLWPDTWVLMRDSFHTSEPPISDETRNALDSLANRYIAFWSKEKTVFAQHRVDAMNSVRRSLQNAPPN